MTTETVTQGQTTTRRVGRPLSSKGRKTSNAVMNYLVNRTKIDQFTASDVRRTTKQNKMYVRNVLSALEKGGAIKKVGKRHQGGKGRPETLYVKTS